MESEFPSIFESFITPAMQQNPVPFEQLFYMAKTFSLSVLPQEWLIELFTDAMSDYRRESKEDAMFCWKALIRNESPEAKEFFQSTIEQALSTAFTDLISLTHGASYEIIIDFIRFLFVQASNYGILVTQEFSTMLTGILASLCEGEPRPGFFAEFVEYLKTIFSSFCKFIRAFDDFLTSLNRITSVDVDSFKVSETSLFKSPKSSRFTDIFRSVSEGDMHSTALSINSIKKLIKKP